MIRPAEGNTKHLPHKNQNYINTSTERAYSCSNRANNGKTSTEASGTGPAWGLQILTWKQSRGKEILYLIFIIQRSAAGFTEGRALGRRVTEATHHFIEDSESQTNTSCKWTAPRLATVQASMQRPPSRQGKMVVIPSALKRNTINDKS